MPFKSEAQRRYLWANEPEIARDWTDTYGSRIQKNNGGIMRLGFANGLSVEEEDIARKMFQTNRNLIANYEDVDAYLEALAEIKEDKPSEEFNILEEIKKIPGDFVESLGETGDVFLDRVSGLQENIGGGLSYLRDKMGAGINWGKKLPGMAMGALSGIPGAGFLINALRRPDYPSDPMSKSFAYGAPNMGKNSGYYGDLRHGNLTGQDQFGINTISRLGNYPAYYDQYARDYKAGKYTHGDAASKFNQRKYAHALAVNKANQDRIAQDFTVTAEDDYGAGNYIAPTSVPVPAHIRQRQGGNQGNKGGAATQAAGDLAGGRDTWGSSPFQRGGIAGLWPR